MRLTNCQETMPTPWRERTGRFIQINFFEDELSPTKVVDWEKMPGSKVFERSTETMMETARITTT
jgi:hypothetical protein